MPAALSSIAVTVSGCGLRFELADPAFACARDQAFDIDRRALQQRARRVGELFNRHLDKFLTQIGDVFLRQFAVRAGGLQRFDRRLLQLADGDLRRLDDFGLRRVDVLKVCAFAELDRQPCASTPMSVISSVAATCKPYSSNCSIISFSFF
jgi:hypothetical protein